MHVSWRPYDSFGRGSEFMRILFKPESQTLWGFHLPAMNPVRLFGGKEDNEEDENNVDMKQTMWLVLRKTKPKNETLKQFYAETSSYPLRIKDIVKFGRVNFKVSALRSSKLDADIQGDFGQAMNEGTNQNVTQINERGLHTSVMHTEMNINDNVTISQILNVSQTE